MELLRSIAGAALVAVVTLAAAPALAQPADFKAQADALVAAAYAAEGPGAAVVIARGGQVIYSAGRGYADLAARRPNGPDTVYKLGSITKQFTAAVILQLVAEGKVSLEDPISKFFPDYPQPGARATVRQLLNHASGIQDYSKIAGWMGTEATARPYTTTELIQVVTSRPAVSEPGTRWEYNNGGYMMLGAIIEKVTGKAWHEALNERIARPLGLSTVTYALVNEADPRRARGYALEGGQWRPANPAHISVAHAAGGLVGSPLDLAKWADALHHGRVVRPDLYQEMLKPARLADGSTQPYGFGLRLQQFRGKPALVHGGAARGVDTGSVYLPADDIYVAVFANSDTLPNDASTLVIRLALLALGEPLPTLAPRPVDVASVEPLFGQYSSGQGAPWRFFSRDGKLFLGRGDDELQAFSAGEDRFIFGPNDLMWFRFVRRPDGAHVLEVNRPNAARPENFSRTGGVPAPLSVPEAVLRSYAGAYQTETLLVTVAVGESGRLTMSAPGQGTMELRPTSQTEFRVVDQPMSVVFYPEGGRVDRLTLHRGARVLNGKRTAP